MKTVERKYTHCDKCNRRTTHYRNINQTGGGGWLLHLLLILATGGAWIVILLIWKIGNIKIGGWHCGECGE